MALPGAGDGSDGGADQHRGNHQGGHCLTGAVKHQRKRQHGDGDQRRDEISAAQRRALASPAGAPADCGFRRIIVHPGVSRPSE